MVDPPGKRLLLQSRFAAVVVPIRLGKGFHPHSAQGQDSPVGILHIPHQDVSLKARGSGPSFPEVVRSLFHYREHFAGIAGHTDKPYPVEPGQHFCGFILITNKNI